MSLFRSTIRWLGESRVLWTLKARTGLARNPMSGALGSLSRAQMDRMLTATFPHCDIIVHEALFGFRPRPNHQILLVESVGPSDRDSGSFVVKVGPTDRIRAEWESWERCRRPGPPGDPVFMPLRPGYPPDGKWGEPFAAIVYDNALRFIGEDDDCACMTLEDAVLGAVRFNSPTIDTVLSTLDQLFDRAGLVLYNRARVSEPNACDFSPPAHRLTEALDRWDQVANLRNLRCYLDTHISRLDRPDHRLPIRRYLGPVPFLRFLLEKATGCSQEAQSVWPAGKGLPPLTREAVIPAVHRGPAHGDFHGRNVLVGVMQERIGVRPAQVRWPAVFDYGSMGEDNYIGMDFVKLETELKVRAYSALFGTMNQEEFTRAVHDCEWDLALQTEENDFPQVAPVGLGRNEQLDRLRSVVLKIRQRAAGQLGSRRERGNWLEEYFYLLCCYGVVPAVFETYTDHNLLAALLSAGVAAARLQAPRQRFEQEMRRVRELTSRSQGAR